MSRQVTTLLAAALILAACTKEIPPTSVEEFVQDRVLLDSTLSRCDLDKADTFDDRNCVNARRAVEKLWREQEKINAGLFERESERKRELLRAQQDRQDKLSEQQRLEQVQGEQQQELYQGHEFSDTPPQTPGVSPQVEAPPGTDEDKPDPH